MRFVGDRGVSPSPDDLQGAWGSMRVAGDRGVSLSPDDVQEAWGQSNNCSQAFPLIMAFDYRYWMQVCLWIAPALQVRVPAIAISRTRIASLTVHEPHWRFRQTIQLLSLVPALQV